VDGNHQEDERKPLKEIVNPMDDVFSRNVTEIDFVGSEHPARLPMPDESALVAV
jgi:hypothetical protein